MAEVIDLRGIGRKQKGRLFAKWAQKMGYKISPEASLSQLPPGLLLLLAQGGQGLESPIEELVAFVRAERTGPLESMPRASLLDVLDTSFVMLDLVRFECMVRLGWLDPLPLREIPIGELISLELEEMRRLKGQPFLRKDHPQYYRFQAMAPIDREGFIRKLIPQAIEVFRRRFGGPC